MAGHVSLMFADMGTVVAQVAAGKVRALGAVLRLHLSGGERRYPAAGRDSRRRDSAQCGRGARLRRRHVQSAAVSAASTNVKSRFLLDWNEGVVPQNAVRDRVERSEPRPVPARWNAVRETGCRNGRAIERITVRTGKRGEAQSPAERGARFRARRDGRRLHQDGAGPQGHCWRDSQADRCGAADFGGVVQRGGRRAKPHRESARPPGARLKSLGVAATPRSLPAPAACRP